MDHCLKIRVITAVKRKYPDFSQKQIKKLIEEKKVLINSRPAKLHDWVLTGDEITFLNKLSLSLKPNKDLNCCVLKQTDDYIFFYKGPCVHSVAHDYEAIDTAANWLLTIDKKLSAVSHPLESGLLHRLDFETSGVMVAARNKKAFLYLKNLFKENKVAKDYVCLISPYPPQNAVYTALAVNKSKNSKRVTVLDSLSNRGTSPQEITTEVLSSQKIKEGEYKVFVRLITGHRHQIRCHLAFLGSPIVGDSLYGGIPAKRLMLHAQKIAFQDQGGKKLVVECEPEF